MDFSLCHHLSQTFPTHLCNPSRSIGLSCASDESLPYVWFCTSRICHLGNLGSSGYADLPNVDTFHQTVSKKKKSHLLILSQQKGLVRMGSSPAHGGKDRCSKIRNFAGKLAFLSLAINTVFSCQSHRLASFVFKNTSFKEPGLNTRLVSCSFTVVRDNSGWFC